MAQVGQGGWRATVPHATRPGAVETTGTSAGSIRLASGTTSTEIQGLSSEQGQVWAEYDLSALTTRFPHEAHPERTVVDWILRETGTEAWFSDVPAVLSATPTQLKVYHTPEVQAVVAGTVDRFLSRHAAGHQFGVRLVTVSNPNWRVKALPRLTSVTVQTPGVEAWLLTREDAAIVLADLKKRSDYREHNTPNLLIANGRSHEIARRRPMAYVKAVAGLGTNLSGPALEPGQVEEGFSVELSPLVERDGTVVDAVVRLETIQVEKLTSVSLLADPSTQGRRSVQVQVPQMSSWRLHERFRWPVHQVLLISCGVVAIPEGESPAAFPVPVFGNRPPRADALLFVEPRGPEGEASAVEPTASRGNGLKYHNRY